MGKYEQVGTIYNWHIPAQRYDGRIKNPDSAYAIDLHTGKDITNSSRWSEGCLTVHETEYYCFGVEAGFLTKLDNGVWPDSYEEIKRDLPSNVGDVTKRENVKEWGHIVVDRQFMSEEDRELFFDED